MINQPALKPHYTMENFTTSDQVIMLDQSLHPLIRLGYDLSIKGINVVQIYNWVVLNTD